LLGELQLSFLLFLRLSCLASLEQWKRLVSLLCGCEAALKAREGKSASLHGGGAAV